MEIDLRAHLFKVAKFSLVIKKKIYDQHKKSAELTVILLRQRDSVGNIFHSLVLVLENIYDRKTY